MTDEPTTVPGNMIVVSLQLALAEVLRNDPVAVARIRAMIENPKNSEDIRNGLRLLLTGVD